MTDACPPLALCGRHRKGLELARALGVPAHIVIDAGHAAGKRLRDYAFFDDPADPRNALLVECGQHWERAAPEVAKQATLRFLRHFGCADAALPRRAPRAATAAAAAGDRGDRLDHDRERRVRVRAAGVGPDGRSASAARCSRATASAKCCTPYDDCVLIMPTRRPKRGETAVRLGRYVDLERRLPDGSPAAPSRSPPPPKSG